MEINLLSANAQLTLGFIGPMLWFVVVGFLWP